MTLLCYQTVQELSHGNDRSDARVDGKTLNDLSTGLQKTVNGRFDCFSRHHLYGLFPEDPEKFIECPKKVKNCNPLCSHSPLTYVFDALAASYVLEVTDKRETRQVQLWIRRKQSKLLNTGDLLMEQIGMVVSARESGELEQQEDLVFSYMENLRRNDVVAEIGSLNRSHAIQVGQQSKDLHGEPIFDLCVTFNRAFHAGSFCGDLDGFRDVTRFHLEDTLEEICHASTS